jgi:hypothetical protein
MLREGSELGNVSSLTGSGPDMAASGSTNQSPTTGMCPAMKSGSATSSIAVTSPPAIRIILDSTSSCIE